VPRRAWRGRTAIACVVATAFLAEPGTGLAQTNGARADELFREGQALLQSGRLEDACPRLGDSFRLDPALGTLMNLALCHEKQGRIATAQREYAAAAMWARERRERDRERFAERRALELENRLSKIRLEFSARPSGLRVVLDGNPLDPGQLDAEISVDPGSHRLEASSEGGRVWSRRDLWIEQPGLTIVRLAPREELSAPAQRASVGSEAVPSERPSPVADRSSASPAATSSTGPSLLGYLIGGAGIASLGVGIAFLLRADALDSESQRHADRARMASPPDPASKAAALEDYNAAVTSQTAGLAAAGVGILGVSASLYLLLHPHRAEPSAAQQAFRIAPCVAPNAASIHLETRF
jgi:tetratricopeptide (TPR) repeat protein